MRRFIKGLFKGHANGFIYGIIMSLFFANIILLSMHWQNTGSKNAVLPRYHFYAIFPGSNDPFWADVKQGIVQAAASSKVAIEFNQLNPGDNVGTLDYLNIARLSQVDGIITQGSGDSQIEQAINEAVEAGIPVVTLETDAKNSKRQAFIGANSYLIGEQAAKLVIQGTRGRARVAVIMSGNAQTDTAAQNSMLNGFLTTLRDAPDAQMVKIYTANPGILNTEEIAQTILRQKNINAIYSVDPLFSVGVAQTVINDNEVGRLTIVGYGISPEIESYIQRGVIYGIVAGNPLTIGSDSIKALLELKEKNHTSSVIDTGITIVNRDTLANYQKKSAALTTGDQT
ncbi:monosaccharide ABC transporter substrate-binding protein, CUT2 family [Desulfosporosinus acidiphilus SJ4]|uniref:Monosaccharide ABC transporter substrate-binding protein, CUT2 family n=1 Tax=Desulfosporosinus acidiphilus (strain DSM 22704 / JCM 16185 / SJ4) TaxID=646529 RepID=I4D2P3_DESAJ|nr:substrate-binding domain-containing protein [Desulfosporosinus acidiphilus]AFM40067.1 monosaccharide ABC transporter substrate-binding protein, CUT2 family [Desulfosporosinus acidiphilus SJ4]